MAVEITVYDFEVTVETDEILKDVGNQMVNYLKQTSPNRSGTYAGGWKATFKDGKITVHNEVGFAITHLLEFGHLARNLKTRVAPQPHIRRTYDKFTPVLENKLKNVKLKIEQKGKK